MMAVRPPKKQAQDPSAAVPAAAPGGVVPRNDDLLMRELKAAIAAPAPAAAAPVTAPAAAATDAPSTFAALNALMASTSSAHAATQSEHSELAVPAPASAPTAAEEDLSDDNNNTAEETSTSTASSESGASAPARPRGETLIASGREVDDIAAALAASEETAAEEAAQRQQAQAASAPPSPPPAFNPEVVRPGDPPPATYTPAPAHGIIAPAYPAIAAAASASTAAGADTGAAVAAAGTQADQLDVGYDPDRIEPMKNPQENSNGLRPAAIRNSREAARAPDTGANWSHVDFTTKGSCSSFDLTHRQMENVDFTGANLSGCRLDGANARGAKFVSTNLTMTGFKNVHLSGGKTNNADFMGAEFFVVPTHDGTYKNFISDFAPGTKDAPNRDKNRQVTSDLHAYLNFYTKNSKTLSPESASLYRAAIAKDIVRQVNKLSSVHARHFYLVTAMMHPLFQHTSKLSGARAMFTNSGKENYAERDNPRSRQILVDALEALRALIADADERGNFTLAERLEIEGALVSSTGESSSSGADSDSGAARRSASSSSAGAW